MLTVTRRTTRNPTAIAAGIAAAGSLVVAYLVLHLWDADLGRPWTLGGEDIGSTIPYVKTTLQDLWPLHNRYLGAPFGQELQDYPLGDPLQIVLTKLLGAFSGDAVVVTNLFFLIGFPLTALTAQWAFMRLELSTPVATACAVLFAVAPYHFLRGEDHLMIAAYYAVPLAAYLIVTLLADRPPPRRVTVVLAVTVGLAFTYYAVFTVLLLVFVLALALAGGRRPAAIEAGIALGALVLVLAVVHLPTWIYDLQHGGNPAVASLHSPEQSERFSLEVPRLIFPVVDHRVGAFASLTRHFAERSQDESKEGPAQALGLLAAGGFLALLWIALRTVARRDDERHDPYLRAASLGTLATLLLGLTGGFALAIVYTVSPLLRSWSRLSIFIAFFALLAVGKGLDWARGQLHGRGMSAAVVTAALGAVVVVAAVDQTSSAMVPDYQRINAGWQADSNFTRAAVQALPHDSVVLQLPYIPFPEQSYEQARFYLHTDSLRWTFGAMSGRSADWTAALAGLPIGAAVERGALAGAAALAVDRSSGIDGGAVRREAGMPLVTSALSELYDLRPLAARLRARTGALAFAHMRELTLHPVQVLPGPQLSAPQKPARAGGFWYRISYEPDAELDLVNPLKAPREVDLELGLIAKGSHVFGLQLPGGASARVVASPSGTARGTIVLQPGHNRVRISDLTPAATFEPYSVNRVVVQDPSVEQFLSHAG